MQRLECCYQTLLKNSVRNTQTLQTFTLPNLTLLGYLQTPILNQNAKTKERKNWVLPNLNRRTCKGCTFKMVMLMDLRSIYQRLAIFRNQIFIFKAFVQKIFLSTRKFRAMKTFARFTNGIWCMDLAFVDKREKEKKMVKSTY